ncbi:hypothetical protein [Alkaliphilus crotonatoxidans]
MKDSNKKSQEIIQDLLYIKQAISKNSNIFKFISLTETLRTVYLFSGIAIISLAGLFYYVIQAYGAYEAVPVKVKGVLYGAVILLIGGIFCLKIRNIIIAFKKNQSNMTLIRLLREVYTLQSALVIVPFVLSAIMVSGFFYSQGLGNLIVPFLGIFLGLLCFGVINIFHIKELGLLGGWFVVTGFLLMMVFTGLHPLIGTIVCFGMGLLMMYGASFILAGSKGE